MAKVGKFHKRDIADHDFAFVVPPEAPIFYPTDEEWADPLLFINKIRAQAELAGICKIVPPSSWKPPFDLDMDSFLFTPRIQHLNELEAKSRVKLNFLDSIAKFWDLQGSNLRIPIVERKALDLHALHRIINKEGGQESVTKHRLWSKVGERMGYPRGKAAGAMLRAHYDRILYPFDIFQAGKQTGKVADSTTKMELPDDKNSDKVVKDYKPHGILSRQAIAPPAQKYSRRSKRFTHPPLPLEAEKSAIPPPVEKPSTSGEYDPLAKYICMLCKRGDAEELMLLCDGCDDSYHTFCLRPPLNDVPKELSQHNGQDLPSLHRPEFRPEFPNQNPQELTSFQLPESAAGEIGDWRCPKCLAVDLNKPMEAFGFEQAKRKYSLRQFGKMADTFKTEYFSKPVSQVQSVEAEREFWRVVTTIEEDVTVEYGADLHTISHGSGFPTKKDSYTEQDAESYAQSPWNLNNLPVANGSILTHIHADISGMKIPWVYVGMLFSAFCWHNEDHWSYSINYLHWGESKTWYGVPGSEAEKFETSMQDAAPELFQTQPDLLHQLVTIINPNILMDEGVSVCRTDQKAGEFVVTFPRAYHAGFNQGFNFAEAVNFAPIDWLPMGRACIAHYASLHRSCVFSHDELVCNMALATDDLEVAIAAAAHKDMTVMVAEEQGLRDIVEAWGKLESQVEMFEALSDDERQCEYCKTTCFLSAITCNCSNKKLVCLNHYDKLCKCAPEEHTFRFRYTMNELHFMLFKLQMKTTAYGDWILAVEESLLSTDTKVELDDLRELSAEARQKNYPKTELYFSLETALERAYKCQDLARKITRSKVHTRLNPMSFNRYSLTVDQLQEFFDECLLLPVTMKEVDGVKILLDKVISFQATATHLLDQQRPSSTEVEACIESASTFNINLPDLVKLGHALQQARWMESVAVIMEDHAALTLDALKRQLAAGGALPPSSEVEKVLVQLQQLVNQVDNFEERAKAALQPTNCQTIELLREIRDEGLAIPASLPTLEDIEDAVEKGEAWIAKYNRIRTDMSPKVEKQFPYLQYVEHLVATGRMTQVLLEGLPGLESALLLAKDWKERAARTFLRKNSRYTLLDALSPRTTVGVDVYKMKKSPVRSESPTYRPLTLFNVVLEEEGDSALVVKAFKDAEEREIAAMVALRSENIAKRSDDSPEVRYCICRRPKSGQMSQCGLCLDWFHMLCVPMPKMSSRRAARKAAEAGETLTLEASRARAKFLCPCCMRSRRPRLETILALLLALQKLGVRIPEGEALQCLTERAMNWQDRARTMLSSPDFSNAMSRLECMTKQLSEFAAREKTEKIISNELMKAACNPVLLGRVQALRGEDEEGDSDSSHKTEAALSSSEHAYSARSPPPLHLNKKHARKSPLVPRQTPTLSISARARLSLEQLMVEGDLLEISIEEVNVVHKLYMATMSPAEMLDDEPMQR